MVVVKDWVVVAVDALARVELLEEGTVVEVEVEVLVKGAR